MGYLNPRWNETADDQDLFARFQRASQMAGAEFFDRVDESVQAWFPARQIVLDAVNARKQFEGADPQGRILLFDRAVNWKGHIFLLERELEIPEEERPLYVIYPDEAGKWRVQAVPVSLESFVSRRPLPEAWRGVRDEQLSELVGRPGCVFVHASGFIGGGYRRMDATSLTCRPPGQGRRTRHGAPGASVGSSWPTLSLDRRPR